MNKVHHRRSSPTTARAKNTASARRIHNGARLNGKKNEPAAVQQSQRTEIRPNYVQGCSSPRRWMSGRRWNLRCRRPCSSISICHIINHQTRASRVNEKARTHMEKNPTKNNATHIVAICIFSWASQPYAATDNGKNNMAGMPLLRRT